MAGDDRPLPSPRTTIVGGRPPEDGAGLPPVPTGIQRLLRLASVDAAFADELVQRPLEVAPEEAPTAEEPRPDRNEMHTRGGAKPDLPGGDGE